MKYIYVLTQFNYSKSKFDPIPLIVEQSNGTLVSIVEICNRGYKNNELFLFNINLLKQYKRKYLNNISSGLWVDSGGYNFLTNWKLDEQSVKFYLNSYIQFMTSNGLFEKIFSLDIPTVPKTCDRDNSWVNTCDNIYNLNSMSQSYAVDALKRFPELKTKYIFTYQFKTASLYKIWKQIYKEEGLGKYVTHRAVGGVVGLHEASRRSKNKNLLFSPVIGPAFDCFNDYINAKSIDLDFKVHFLGISTELDQFVIIFLEKLFTYYLYTQGSSSKADFSIDTRSNSKNVEVGIRTTGIYSFEPGRYPNRIHRDYLIRDIPNSRLRNIYDKHYSELISQEISDNISWDKNVSQLSDFYPLSLYSNNNLLKYFDWFINSNELLKKLVAAENKDDIENQVKDIFNKLLPKPNKSKSVPFENILDAAKDIDKEVNVAIARAGFDFTVNEAVDKLTPLYDIFKSPRYHNKVNNLDNKIVVSIGRVYEFHRWLVDDRGPEQLEELMLKFIDDIGIEDVLT